MSNEYFLIIADGYDSVATAQEKRKIEPSFDVETLRAWLKYLRITKYDVAWSRDAKLASWQGPVLALGDAAYAAAVKLGKRVYKLPHPTTHSTTIKDPVKMKAILDAVEIKINRKGTMPRKRIVVVK